MNESTHTCGSDQRPEHTDALWGSEIQTLRAMLTRHWEQRYHRAAPKPTVLCPRSADAATVMPALQTLWGTSELFINMHFANTKPFGWLYALYAAKSEIPKGEWGLMVIFLSSLTGPHWARFKRGLKLNFLQYFISFPQLQVETEKHLKWPTPHMEAVTCLALWLQSASRTFCLNLSPNDTLFQGL